VTSVKFDIFAREHASKELDKLDRKFRDTAKKMGDFGDKAAVSFAKTASSLSNIPTAAAGLAGVGQVVAGLSGVLGLIPAAAAAAAAGFATLAVGTHGFLDGLKELGNSKKISGGAASAADASVQAARQIEAAHKSLVRAQRSTKDAEEALARAQEDSRDAQQSLTRARKAAAEQLEDLQRALTGAALDEESAVLAVERAHERLAEAQKEGASGLDMREAELGLRQAQQALEETRDRYGDLKTEAAEAAKAGVEGSDEVIAAQKAVADAARGVQQAQQGVADAAENVRDAQQEVARAHEDAARAAGKSSAGMAGLTENFDKLSNNAKDTVRAILSLSDGWTKLQHTVQDALFAGVAQDVKLLGGTYLPVLAKGMGGVATEFNTGARSTAAFLAEARQVQDVGMILSGTKTIAGEFAQTLKPIVSIFLDMSAVGMEVLTGLTGGLGKAAESAAAFVRNARETGQLRAWIETGLETVRKLGELFSNVGSIISTVFSGLNLGGANFLDTLIRVSGKVEEFLKSFEGQQALKALGTALSAVSAAVTQVLLVALDELAPIIVTLAPGFAELAKQVGEVLVAAMRIAGPLLQAIAKGLADNVEWLGPLAIGLYAGAKAFEAVNVVLKAMGLAALSNPWLLLIAATIALAILIITHWEDIKKALAAAWEWIKRTAGQVWEGIKNVIINPITTAASWIRDRFNDVVSFFADLPRKIGSALGRLGDFIGDAFKAGVNVAIRALNWGIDRINDLIYGVNVISPFGDIPYIRHIGYLAKGGPAMAGQPYVVGEKGPELFVPNMSGMVVPNHKLDSMNPTTPGNWGPSPNYAVPRGAMSPAQSAGPMVLKVELVTSASADAEVGNLINHLVRSRKVQLRVNGQQVVA